MIQFLQWNLNSAHKKIEELHYLAGINKTQIICLQVTRLIPDIPFRFRNFSIHRIDVPESGKVVLEG
jgi:hypothetical protein